MIHLTIFTSSFKANDFQKIDPSYALNNNESQILENLSKLGKASMHTPSFSPLKIDEEIQKSPSIIAANILELYSNAIYISYSGRLTELQNKGGNLNNIEAQELVDLEELTKFKQPKLAQGLPITQKLSFASEDDGIKNYALYAAADTVNEVLQEKSMQAYISTNDKNEINGFLTFRPYAKNELLEDKDAIYVSQMGAFPLANGKGKELIAEVTGQDKPVILLTRKFNSRAKAVYSKIFEQLSGQDAISICEKLKYNSDKYDVYIFYPKNIAMNS